ASRALDEPHSQALFQVGNTATELRLGHTKNSSGGRESTVVHHLDEIIKIVQVLHHRSPNRTISPTFTVYMAQRPMIMLSSTSLASHLYGDRHEHEEDTRYLQRPSSSLGGRRLSGALSVLVQQPRQADQSFPVTRLCRP